METSSTQEVQVKENWSTPELKVMDINEDTLGAAGVGADAAVFS